MMESLTYVEFGLGALSFLVIILMALLVRMELRLKRLMRGRSAASLEEHIGALVAHAEEVDRYRREVARSISHLEERLAKTLSGFSTVRFNAFSQDGSGGSQSFATALLSEEGKGVVISSLHAREHTRIFAKPITQFSSEYELTTEEKKAVQEARSRATTN